MSARRDPQLCEVISEADIATPDGMPVAWCLRLTGHPGQERVYGPELMRRALAQSGDFGWSHYLYGGSEETLKRLQAAVDEFAPAAKIVGAHSPPFRDLTPEEEAADYERIRAAGADIVWVGLGMPKQELWMGRARHALPGLAIAGVGAAFDFLAGTKKQAPEWMQRSGLEWLFRLATEPRRLWRRYIYNNPAYLVLMARQVAKWRIRQLLRRS